MYKCFICGQSYENPVDAAKCTISCDEQKRKQADERRKKKVLECQMELDSCLRRCAQLTYTLNNLDDEHSYKIDYNVSNK